MNFFDLIPSFLSGVTALHDELVAVTLIRCFAGLLVHCVYALLSQKGRACIPDANQDDDYLRAGHRFVHLD